VRMNNRFVIILGGVSLCLLMGLLLPAKAGPRVMAHYMPWFGCRPNEDGSLHWEHWHWSGEGPSHDPNTILPNGRRDIASVFYPLIGPYDNSDPAVLEYHFLTAKACGIEGFIADWYGGGYTDLVFTRMVATAERYDMKVAICLEEKTFYPGYIDVATRAEAVDEAERQLRLVLNTHACSSAYWRIDGQPVFLIFLGYRSDSLGEHILRPDELADLLGRVDPPGIHFIREHANEDYDTLVDGGYAWIDGPKYRNWFYPTATVLRATGKWETSIGAVNPGFDDTGVWGWGNGPRVTERRGVAEYTDNWAAVMRGHPDVIQVTTWNDFEEGTTIEPAEEYGFTFIDLTERFVGEWTGRKTRMDDNRWPYRLFMARKGLEGAAVGAPREALSGKLDAWAQAFSQGRRWRMEWRLDRLERAVGMLAGQPRR